MTYTVCTTYAIFMGYTVFYGLFILYYLFYGKTHHVILAPNIFYGNKHYDGVYDQKNKNNVLYYFLLPLFILNQLAVLQFQDLFHLYNYK